MLLTSLLNVVRTNVVRTTSVAPFPAALVRTSALAPPPTVAACARARRALHAVRAFSSDAFAEGNSEMHNMPHSPPRTNGHVVAEPVAPIGVNGAAHNGADGLQFGAPAPGESLQSGRPPSPRQLTYAHELAQEVGETVPPEAEEDMAVCSALIEKLKPMADAQRGKRPPSDQQVQLAQQLAANKDIDVPENALRESQACSQFIEQQQEYSPIKREPTPKQLAFALTLAERAGVELPAEAQGDMMACSRFIEQFKGAVPPGASGPGGSIPRPPSERQLAFAQQLATQHSVALPDAARADSQQCSAFITQFTRPSRAPSDSQLIFAATLARNAGQGLPADVLKDKVACAAFIDSLKGGTWGGAPAAGAYGAAAWGQPAPAVTWGTPVPTAPWGQPAPPPAPWGQPAPPGAAAVNGVYSAVPAQWAQPAEPAAGPSSAGAEAGDTPGATADASPAVGADAAASSAGPDAQRSELISPDEPQPDPNTWNLPGAPRRAAPSPAPRRAVRDRGAPWARWSRRALTGHARAHARPARRPSAVTTPEQPSVQRQKGGGCNRAAGGHPWPSFEPSALRLRSSGVA